MGKMSFLHERSEKENARITNIVRKVIVDSSVQMGLISDANLTMIPESINALSQLAHSLREDLFSYHNTVKKSLQFPVIRNQFTYAFAKGAESAYLWNHSSDGRYDFNYDMEDSLLGNAGAQVNQEFADKITLGMMIVGDVFIDFQDAFVDKKNKFLTGDGKLLSDVIATGYFWASQIGVDFGLNILGMK